MCILTLNHLSGIDVVRNRIKGFAQKKVTLPPGRHKIVILDVADRYFIALPFHSSIISQHEQHDPRCPTSSTTDNGNLLVYDPIRICMQPVEQDYRTDPVSMRYPPL